MKGKGIGTQLYNAFIEHAYDTGVKRVEWAVLDWNLPAIKFYQKSGATISDDWRSVQMDKKSIDNYISKLIHKNESIQVWRGLGQRCCRG